jgi:hypothetical protein
MPFPGLRCRVLGRRRLLCAVQNYRFIHSLRKLRCLHFAGAKPMMLLPWRVSGARLQMPRDLQIAYTVGRMGVVTIADTYALWYGSPHTARFGFGRLVRLGLLRSFPRTDPLAPAWYSLTPQGLEWTAEQAGCDERELRAVAGIRRMHLPSMRNQLWTSVVLACREAPLTCIRRFQPEWELRPLKREDMRVVPDAAVTLGGPDKTSQGECSWLLELDAGTERTSVWRAKAREYVELRGAGRVYGVGVWRLLAVVPTAKRALTVAVAITAGGAGAFSYVGVIGNLVTGQAFARVLWPCLELAKAPAVAPSVSLIDGLDKPISEADQRARSTVDRVAPLETERISP